MKYIRQFSNLSAYLTAKTGTFYKPAVSLLRDQMECRYDNLDSIPEMVDLGLSVKWASLNVGALQDLTDPTIWYGNYYAWAEVETKGTYTWENYKYGTEDNLTKYNDSDRLVTLQSTDDIVTQLYGSDYRMPTENEIKELLNNTTRSIVSDYSGVQGLNGVVFTGNNNSIFIPCAGAIGDVPSDQGSNIRLWSSSLGVNFSGVTSACFFGLGSSQTSPSFYYGARCVGGSVRAVSTL